MNVDIVLSPGLATLMTRNRETGRHIPKSQINLQKLRKAQTNTKHIFKELLSLSRFTVNSCENVLSQNTVNISIYLKHATKTQQFVNKTKQYSKYKGDLRL